MAISRQERAAENELLKAFSNTMWTEPLPYRDRDCPSIDELRLFVRGKACSERHEYLVAHLFSCDRCIEVLQKRRARRWMVKEVALIFAAAAVLLVAIWTGSRDLMQIRDQIDTVDLRPFALTRGGATVIAAGQTPAVAVETNRLRLILPAGSEGQYECEILGGRKDTALINAGAEASVREGQVIIEFAVPSAHIPAGQYTLALRKQGSDWVYYPVLLK